MLGVEFEKIKNVTFLIYKEGMFFSKKETQLHSSFKGPVYIFIFTFTYLNISIYVYIYVWYYLYTLYTFTYAYIIYMYTLFSIYINIYIVTSIDESAYMGHTGGGEAARSKCISPRFFFLRYAPGGRSWTLA